MQAILTCLSLVSRALQASPAEPDWQHTFWGDNYDRLVSIKRDLDPEDVLWCNPCVGNERWEEVGAQLCRVAT